MALDNFIPKSNTGRCKECRKYKGRLTCTIYPKWIPDKAMDEGCPEFEKKEGGDREDGVIVFPDERMN